MKNKEMFWVVLNGFERYKFPERKDKNEFRGKAGGANQKKQEPWKCHYGISAAQWLDTGGAGMAG